MKPQKTGKNVIFSLLRSVGQVLAAVGGTLLGSADLGLVVVRDLLLDDLETLVDQVLNGLLRAGEHPDVLSLSEKVGVAGVDDGDVLVIGVEDSVVTSGSIGEELDLALSTVEGGDSSSAGDLVGLGIVLGVEDSDSAVSVEGVASLLAVVGFPGHAGVSRLLVPQAHVA